MRSKWILGLALALSAAQASAAASEKVVLDVRNVTCAACSITIGRALDKVPGVQSKRIDAKAATVTVVFDPSRTSVTAVSRAITNAGFPARARANGG